MRRVAREKLGKKAVFPGFVKPALAEQLSRPPKGEGWIHEVKFDGYRVQIHIANDAVKVFTRRGHDWTSRLKKISTDAWHINARSAIIDGEVVAPAADGVSDFSVLQKEIRAKRSDKLVMYAFDLLYLNGNDLRAIPIEDRKERLHGLIRKTNILFSESFEADGAIMFARACEMGIEGIVSKRKGSRYRSDRNNDWIKSTCRQRETLVIVGYALKENRFDGLYVGRRDGEVLEYAGKVDHGFSSEQVADLQEKFKGLVQNTQAYTKKIAKPKAVWLKPMLLAEIEYRARSAHGKLRHPSFKGLREDL
ncbi:non-homologous end-joining DNA ligase [Bradyrhizobium sp. SYSU BS000235]|uniref:non-homologous end-joining DNA ligase n=1 Tax=Bradyrhizobium sp. SYSU BS000235 TaxID=3411332 RepID=UPI003C7725A5